MRRSRTLSIKTPEGVAFSQILAGPSARFFAWLIDTACLFAVGSLLGTVLGLLRALSPGIAQALMIIGYFVASIAYGIVLEWAWRGQTIGKKVMGLRVVDVEGMRLQFDQIVTRNLLRAVDMLPVAYFVGGVTSWFSERCQRLGDMAANTVVVYTPQIFEPDLDQLLSGKFNSLRQYPHLVARLRQRVSPGEAATALRALIRRNEFEPAARVELFEQLAQYFQEKVAFPQEATDGVPDEQYLRNVVDVIYR
jgi:uncharacterized RDD family membrane protein YckC